MSDSSRAPAFMFLKTVDLTDGSLKPFVILSVPEDGSLFDNLVLPHPVPGRQAFAFPIDKKGLERLAYDALQALGKVLPD